MAVPQEGETRSNKIHKITVFLFFFRFAKNLEVECGGHTTTEHPNRRMLYWFQIVYVHSGLEWAYGEVVGMA